MGTGLIDFFEDVKRRSYEEGYAEGYAEGLSESKEEGVKTLVMKMGCSFDVACDLLDITGDMKKKVASLF